MLPIDIFFYLSYVRDNKSHVNIEIVFVVITRYEVVRVRDTKSYNTCIYNLFKKCVSGHYFKYCHFRWNRKKNTKNIRDGFFKSNKLYPSYLHGHPLRKTETHTCIKFWHLLSKTTIINWIYYRHLNYQFWHVLSRVLFVQVCK